VSYSDEHAVGAFGVMKSGGTEVWLLVVTWYIYRQKKKVKLSLYLTS
jgi:hypothetical protein